uniref:Mtv-9 protein n=1 Tax=Mus musculus TaxID=10090 RepID=Q61915_MOUSE|nr:Mtv-9 protein [Mus musculus]
MPRLQQKWLNSRECPTLRREAAKGLFPTKDDPSACTRMSPSDKDILILCCKLGIALLCLGLLGEVAVRARRALTLDSFNSSSVQDYNLNNSENSTFLLGQGPQPTSSYKPHRFYPSEIEIRMLAKNYIFTNKTNPIGRLLIIMLRNESLPFSTIFTQIQRLEMGIENRKRRSTAVKEQVQGLSATGLEVKKGKRSVFVKIGDRWWQPGTYRGPYIYRPTDAPLPYTGRYDLNFNRWVTVNGYKVLYRSLPFRERLARARPPWCVLTQEEKDDMKQQVHDYIYLGTGMNVWGKIFHYTKEGAVARLLEHISADTFGMSYNG